MKRGYQAITEMNSVWKSLETEVIDDIRRNRTEQLHYRLNLIITEGIMFGVSREDAEAYVQERVKPHNIHFIPEQPKRGRKKVAV